MLRSLPHLAALAILLGSGLVHGLWTSRWSESSELQDRAARIDRLPSRIGDWEGHDLPVEKGVRERGEIDGLIMRRYENRRTGAAVSVLLVCGRPGPIAAHTPELCYGGAGFDPSSRWSKLALGGEAVPSADEFWVVDFSKRNSALPEHLRIFYAWSDRGTWMASSSPRLDFAGSPALYKIYVVRPLSKPDEAPGDDPAAGFLRQLSPELKEALFADS